MYYPIYQIQVSEWIKYFAGAGVFLNGAKLYVQAGSQLVGLGLL
jgi:hypothetical protein